VLFPSYVLSIKSGREASAPKKAESLLVFLEHGH